MSISENILIVNWCNTWQNLIYPLKEVEYQREYWFSDEKWYVSSYIDATSDFLQYYDDHLARGCYDSKLNEECKNLLYELYKKVDGFNLDIDRLSKYEYEEALLQDPHWQEVVSLATDTYEALERYKQEREKEGIVKDAQ